MDERPRRVEERIVAELLLIVALLGVAVVQVTLLPTPAGFPPDLMLVLVVCRILASGRSLQPDGIVSRALRWAFYGGLALDLLTATPFGAHAIALLAVALLVVALTRWLRIDGLLLPLGTVLVAAVVYEAILVLAGRWAIQPIDWRSYTLVVIAPSTLMALVLTLPIFTLMRWWMLREQ